MFNSVTDTTKKDIPVVEEIKPKKETPKIEEDDDWGAIPAFLRRSRLK
jgi:hypothetical protein